MLVIWWRIRRVSGWLWMPVGWWWRGCFDGGAAHECVRQAWLDLTTRHPRILENKVFDRDYRDEF